MKSVQITGLRLAGLAALLLVVTGLPAKADTLTLAGGREGGLWSRIGLGLAQAVKAGAPDITLAYVASQDGVTNAKLLSRGGLDLALIQSAELTAARRGIPPFSETLEGLTAVAGLGAAAPVHVLARADLLDVPAGDPPASFGEAVEGRDLVFGLMPENGVSAAIGHALLAQAGIVIPARNPERVVLYGGLRQQLRRLGSGEIDVLIAPILPGHRAVREAYEATPLALLALASDSVTALKERFGLAAGGIPAGAYAEAAPAVPTAASELVLAARAGSAEASIEAVTRSLYENLGRLRAVHPLLSGLTRQRMAAVAAAPLHPGAEAYLEASGLLPAPE